jgi:hypothetical protein
MLDVCTGSFPVSNAGKPDLMDVIPSPRGSGTPPDVMGVVSGVSRNLEVREFIVRLSD